MKVHENPLKDIASATSYSPRSLKRKKSDLQVNKVSKASCCKHTDAFSSYPCMNKKMTRLISANPRTTQGIDLTRPLGFQPSVGSRHLEIKNLRTKSRKDTAEYYDKIKEDIDSALTSIFAHEQPKCPFEILCRGVELLCRRGRAEELYKRYHERISFYLEKVMLPQIEAETKLPHVETLRAVYKYWMEWNKQSTLIRSIYCYLDRSFLLNSKEYFQMEDLNIQQFRSIVFTKGKSANGQKLGENVISNICDLVDFKRTKRVELFDAALLRQSIQMLHIFGIYGKLFEQEFLERSREFFLNFTASHSSIGMKEYVHACDKLLRQEILCCDTFNFDSTTKKSLLDLMYEYLIIGCSEILLNETELAKLIDENAMPTLKVLYKLLSISGIQTKLKTPFENYIKEKGSKIVCNVEKVEEMIIRLLELKKLLEKIIQDTFNNDETFFFSLRESFGNFMNNTKALKVWGTRSSKVGEKIAKYMDMLLRGGLKAVPQSLISEAQGPMSSENLEYSETRDEDAELDRQLEHALDLFRFVEGKDLFEAFYKKDLARRLLMGRSASYDAERNMLGKLKNECGYTFTHNLEQMFKDQEISRDEMLAYRQSMGNGGSKPRLDLHVNVLCAASWPSYPDIKVNLPPEVAKHLESYDNFYMKKHSGRRLAWKHSLAHSVVKAKFNKGHKELLVSAYQAIVLVLFNDVEATEPLSYTTIQHATGLVDVDLERTLQSLSCAKFRVLTKHPKGRDVHHTDTFTVNVNFSDPKYKIKINQIQLKETKEENKETHDRVMQDRQYETQAAIVRIMKSRKTITHSNLISEVIEQTRKRGSIEISQIKSNIDRLIDKEYLERVNGGSYVYCA
ncbi:Cullin-4B [Erysiphe neolycopersici]|uniref:Cullin-4B n=1 Tax=Erysiphe neolycopersici TaxID=212602 RepID=A0A420H6S6_9PEZI|nr:Cullin-4B [Erysiphe neolycopersici]